jgi:hypothetical protein
MDVKAVLAGLPVMEVAKEAVVTIKTIHINNPRVQVGITPKGKELGEINIRTNPIVVREDLVSMEEIKEVTETMKKVDIIKIAELTHPIINMKIHGINKKTTDQAKILKMACGMMIFRSRNLSLAESSKEKTRMTLNHFQKICRN